MKTIKQFFFTAILLVFPFLLLAQATRSEKPNIVWINCEDIGPALGAYGDYFATTPNLDQMAKEGILFKKAFATAPICSPSQSTLITGMYATSLGTQHLRSEIKRPDFVKTLPELLRAKGYYTSNYGKTDYNFDDRGLYDYKDNDLFPSVQIMTAEYLLYEEENTEALNVLKKWVQDDRGYLALQAARSIELIGKKALPIVPTLKQVLADNSGENDFGLPYEGFYVLCLYQLVRKMCFAPLWRGYGPLEVKT